MYSCRDATGSLTEYREGGLAGARRVRFRFHMLVCPHCRAFRRQFDEALAVAKEIPREEVAPEVEDRLAEVFRARRG